MKKHRKVLWAVLFLSFWAFNHQKAIAQFEDFHTVNAQIDFSNTLREWDGFGVNYVQTVHTWNYSEFPQDYG